MDNKDIKNLRDALNKYRELSNEMSHANSVMIQIVTHPEATDDNIIMVCRQRMHANARMESTKYKLQALLSKHKITSMHATLGGLIRQLGFDGPVREPLPQDTKAESRWSIAGDEMVFTPQNDKTVQSLISALSEINETAKGSELEGDIEKITQKYKQEVFGEEKPPNRSPTP